MRGDREAEPYAAGTIELAHRAQNEREIEARDMRQQRVAFICVREGLVHDQEAIAALERG